MRREALLWLVVSVLLSAALVGLIIYLVVFAVLNEVPR
jgi:hypothetical protein